MINKLHLGMKEKDKANTRIKMEIKKKRTTLH